MTRPPLWRRLLDPLALLATTLGAAGMAASAVYADRWPSRIVFAVIAVALVVVVIRGTRILSRE